MLLVTRLRDRLPAVELRQVVARGGAHRSTINKGARVPLFFCERESQAAKIAADDSARGEKKF